MQLATCAVHGTALPCYVCSTAAAQLGSPWDTSKTAPAGRIVTTRSYRMECVSCQGSGQSQRPTQGTTKNEQCKGCGGLGWVHVTETTTS